MPKPGAEACQQLTVEGRRVAAVIITLMCASFSNPHSAAHGAGEQRREDGVAFHLDMGFMIKSRVPH